MRRFHFTIALAVALASCTCFAPQYAARTDSKTIAKSGKAVAVKKESLRHRTNADTRTKIAATPITVKTTPQRDDKSNAESKNSIATKIQSPQPSQSNAESHMNAIAAKTETSQSPQLDDEPVIRRAMVTIAAKMDTPALYVVQKDEAYIGAYALATAEYRSICN